MAARRVNRCKPRARPAQEANNWGPAQKRAEADMRRSKAMIEAGESFASQKRSERRGSPSKYRGGRIS